jgi:hypothetical protein
MAPFDLVFSPQFHTSFVQFPSRGLLMDSSIFAVWAFEE